MPKQQLSGDLKVVLHRLNDLDRKQDEQSRELKEIRTAQTAILIQMAGLRVRVATISAAVATGITAAIAFAVRVVGGK